MKELGKYVLLMVMFIFLSFSLVLGVPISDANSNSSEYSNVSRINLEALKHNVSIVADMKLTSNGIRLVSADKDDVRYNFTGNKSRFVFELDKKIDYKIIEDWEENSITVEINNASSDFAKNINNKNWKSYIVKNTEITRRGNIYILKIFTDGEFKIKYDSLDKGKRFYVDVFKSFDAPSKMAFIKRGESFAKRQEYSKAVAQFEKASKRYPSDNRIKFNLGKNLHLAGDNKRAMDVLDTIDENSSYFAKSLPVVFDVLKEIDNNSQINGDDNKSGIEDNSKSISNIDNPNNDEKSIENKSKSSENIKNLDDSNGESEKSTLADGTENLDLASKEKDNSVSGSNDVAGENNSQQEVDPNKVLESSMFGIGDIVSKSGAENYLLYIMYIVLAGLFVTVMILGKKVLSIYSSKDNKKSRNKVNSAGRKVSNRKKSGRKLEKNPMIAREQYDEVQNFASKLANLYKTTDESVNTKSAVELESKNKLAKAKASNDLYSRESIKKKLRTKENDNKIAIPLSEINLADEVVSHTEKIERIFENDNPVFDTESVNLIKKFKGTTNNSANSGDKNEAIHHLIGQGWEEWEIARELGMAVEEVKLATEVSNSTTEFEPVNELYENIYKLSDLTFPTVVIAEKLKIGEEEVKLALKVRESVLL